MCPLPPEIPSNMPGQKSLPSLYYLDLIIKLSNCIGVISYDQCVGVVVSLKGFFYRQHLDLTNCIVNGQ